MPAEMKNVYTIDPSLYTKNTDDRVHPIKAQNAQNSAMTVPVAMRCILLGIAIAMIIMAINMPIKTIGFPKMNEIAVVEDATPRAQNADISSPINMRKYTRLSTELVCV